MYTSTASNVVCAIEERITKKRLPFIATPEDQASLKGMAKAMLGEKVDGYLCPDAPFTKSRIKGVLSEVFDLAALKSSKWSPDRFNTAFEKLHTMVCPEYQFKAAVKLEPSQPNKPPRLLIADGDEGQVMALLSIWILEKLMFHHFEERCIKELPKQQAMDRVVDYLRQTVPCSTCEQDGSSWDTTMSVELRDLVENTIIKRITECITEFFIAEDVWSKQHLSAGKKKRLQLRVSVKDEPWKAAHKAAKIIIAAMRRSGHRGTSGLNWLENFCLTHVVHFGKNAPRFVNKTMRVAKDIFGKKRRIHAAFEGDDGATTISPPLTDDEEKVILERWESMGIRMKLLLCCPEKTLTFCGWKTLVDLLGPRPRTSVPDLPRTMTSGVVSTSTAMRAALEGGDVKTMQRLAAGTLIAAADAYSQRLPTVGSWFRAMADEYTVAAAGGPLFTHDDLMKRDPGLFDSGYVWAFEGTEQYMKKLGIEVRKQEAVDLVDYAWEAKLMHEHGWASSEDTAFDSLRKLSCIHAGTSSDDFRSEFAFEG